MRQAVEKGDYSVRGACEATRSSHVHVRKAADERLATSEQEHCQSVTGSLQWVVDSQAVVSKVQQVKKQATVAAAVVANKVVKYLKKTASPRLLYLTGIFCRQLGDFLTGSVCDAVPEVGRTNDVEASTMRVLTNSNDFGSFWN